MLSNAAHCSMPDLFCLASELPCLQALGNAAWRVAIGQWEQAEPKWSRPCYEACQAQFAWQDSPLVQWASQITV